MSALIQKKRSVKNNWGAILKMKKPLLTKKEAEAIRKRAEKLRKEFRMRI